MCKAATDSLNRFKKELGIRGRTEKWLGQKVITLLPRNEENT